MSDLNISKKPSLETSHNDVEVAKSEYIDERNADIALQYLAHNERIEYTEAEATKVRWKIDLFLLPIVSCFAHPFEGRRLITTHSARPNFRTPIPR